MDHHRRVDERHALDRWSPGLQPQSLWIIPTAACELTRVRLALRAAPISRGLNFTRDPGKAAAGGESPVISLTPLLHPHRTACYR